MLTVKNISEACGVSIRAVRHYDALGLLKPVKVTEAGYRLYDETSVARLQSILFFRELGFQLREIKAILDDPATDYAAVLEDRLRFLEKQLENTRRLIGIVRGISENGVKEVEKMVEYGRESERLRDEAREKWSGTAAYAQFKARRAAGKDMKAAGEELMAMFARMGKIKHLDPSSPEAQRAVDAVRGFINDNFYDCTPEIFASLGKMYIADDRFKANIDAAGGEGTADFVSRAIEIYCKAAAR